MVMEDIVPVDILECTKYSGFIECSLASEHSQSIRSMNCNYAAIIQFLRTISTYYTAT